MTAVPGTPSSTESARPPSRAVVGAHLVWVLLLAATIPWRKNVYYEGGVDTVVLAKAALSVLALALAIYFARDRLRDLDVPGSPVLMLLAYLAVTIVGGDASGQLSAAVVLAVRVAILAFTVVFLAARFPSRVVLSRSSTSSRC